MGMIVYRSSQYAIQEVYDGQRKGYILMNTNKEFQEGHSHLNNFQSAKYLIKLLEKGKLPYDLDKYRLESLVRVSEDGDYRDKAILLLQQKKQKETKKYINVHVKHTYC